MKRVAKIIPAVHVLQAGGLINGQLPITPEDMIAYEPVKTEPMINQFAYKVTYEMR